MSLHAQLSPEAQARLDSQRRNSTISSIVIALLLIALIGVILFIISITLKAKEIPTIVTYNAGLEENEDLEVKRINNSVERKPSAPSSSMAKVIASTTATPTAIPVPEVDVPDPSTDFGDGDDFGSGWGDGGDGGGGGFGNIPSAMRKRCTKADRMARLEATGGKPECEDAVLAALRFLQKTQNKDGSWDGQYKGAMTGLALLAYLGHCETPLSEEFGDTVLAATTYLIDLSMKNKGKIASDFHDRWCYEHAIATYALCECYTFSNQLGYTVPNIEPATQSAVQWIINNQNEAGGWNYKYEEKARWDTSITAWHLQALKAAQMTGLDFKNIRRCIDRGLGSILDTQASHGGFGYGKNGPNGSTKGHYSLTGAGALCVQQHRGTSNANSRKGIKYIDKECTFTWNDGADLYEHYYVAQAVINHGSEPWKKYNAMFQDELLNNQNDDGSWGLPGGHQHHTVNSLTYTTCLATLMLEVYYRFLPGTGTAKN